MQKEENKGHNQGGKRAESDKTWPLLPIPQEKLAVNAAAKH